MYIRTKDGVYEVKKEEVLCGTKFYHLEKDEHFNPIRDEFVIKEADTIEELCDYLMFVDNDEKEDILITDVNEVNITYSKNETCYACLKIKLSNGAIRIEPVAKFNEKWSFELI